MAPTPKIPYRFRIGILLFFLILITYLDRITISLVGVRIKTAFHLTNSQFGYVLGAFALAYAIFEVPSAIMGDRLGQRKVFLRIVIWWSVFTALTGAVNGFMSLVIVRFLFGMGEAGAYPNGTATVCRWFPKPETSRGISMMMLGSTTGAAIAPLIVIPIAASFGWRAPFYVNAAIGLGWVLVCWLWFRNHPGEMRGISAKEKELIETQRRFVSDHSGFEWGLVLRHRSIWMLLASYFCIQWANYFFVAWMPNYLQEGKQFSEQEMKLTTTVVFLFTILSSGLGGIVSDRLIKKMGPKAARRIIGIVSFGIMAVLILISTKTTSHRIVAACLIGAHFFLSPAVMNSFSSCIEMGGDRAGTVAGIMNFFGQAGAFIMSIFFGKIVDLTSSFDAPQFLMAGVLLVGAILWTRVDVTSTVTAASGENPVPRGELN
jgi:ACS family glucarate transporter-like MFS transporter